MNVYDYTKDNIKLYFNGDIHGEFKAFFSVASQLQNVVIVLLGDCGLGFYKPNYYTDGFKKANKRFQERNIHILMIRGNHDDPSYYFDEVINFSNIKSIPDYSVILTQEGNILCIGGATSVDRTWRIKEEVVINKYRQRSSFKKKLYWDNEQPYMETNLIPFLTENNLRIDIIASHTCPTFPVHNICDTYVTEWSLKDATLLDDIKSDKEILDNVFYDLKNNGNELKYWYHGHYHIDYEWCDSENDNIIFIGVRDVIYPLKHSQIAENNNKIDKLN